VRLATYNIKNGLCADGSCDPDVLVGACAALRADVLGLQEVDRRAPRSADVDQTGIIAAGCDVTALYGPVRRMRQGGEYGNALLVRGSITDVEHVPLPVAPRREHRAALLARAEISGVALSVAVTHLQNRRGGAPQTAQEAGEQLDQLAAVLRTIALRPRPRVLLGDLNVHPEVAEPALERAGYQVARSAPTARGRARLPKLRLDYVAADGLTLGSSEVLGSTVSDHWAVVVEAVV
jgi:endonuclease/exonuclease/phosphatase family metal-dependent hydrolase